MLTLVIVGFFLLYTVIGVILSIPYAILVGGYPEGLGNVWALLTMVYLLPIGIGIWIYSVKQIFCKKESLENVMTIILFSFLMSLPILMHWGSIYLGMQGLARTASILEAHKYLSPIYLVIILIVGVILLDKIISMKKKVKKGT